MPAPTPVSIESIQLAAQYLEQGLLIALPTETVYGLGADASNPTAVANIFKAKGRPSDHPLIVHIADTLQLEDWAINIPNSAYVLAEQFWPGPLTLVLQKHPHVPDAVTGGQSTVALRIPGNPVALEVLKLFKGGVAAPSANRFGRISPTRAEHVAEELGNSVALILDAGPCSVGVESTIIDLTTQPPALLRPGRITQSQIEKALQQEISLTPQTKIRAPGMMAVHYAPQTAAYLLDKSSLVHKMQSSTLESKRIGILIYSEIPEDLVADIIIKLPFNKEEYEVALYDALRQLDKGNLDAILIEHPPCDENWSAVNDRLGKATIQ